MSVNGNRFDVLAAGHRAGPHLVRGVLFVAAVHWSTFVFRRPAFFRGMMVAVNRALIAGATRASDGHKCRTGDRRVGEKESDKTSTGAQPVCAQGAGLGGSVHSTY